MSRVAVLLVAVLHFLPDSDNPWALVDAIKQQAGARQLRRDLPRHRG